MAGTKVYPKPLKTEEMGGQRIEPLSDPRLELESAVKLAKSALKKGSEAVERSLAASERAQDAKPGDTKTRSQALHTAQAASREARAAGEEVWKALANGKGAVVRLYPYPDPDRRLSMHEIAIANAEAERKQTEALRPLLDAEHEALNNIGVINAHVGVITRELEKVGCPQLHQWRASGSASLERNAMRFSPAPPYMPPPLPPPQKNKMGGSK